MGHRINIGKFSYTGTDFQTTGDCGTIFIGKYCSISDHVTLLLSGHNADWITTYPFSAPEFRWHWPEANGIEGHPKYYGDIEIGSDVWIGYRATVFGGTKIGHGSIIAANALVLSSTIAPYSVVGGVPAQFIKFRFAENEIEELLKIQWWEWDEAKIKENLPLLCSKNIQEFIQRHKID